MEITDVFKDCLKTIKRNNKSIDEMVSHELTINKNQSKYIPTNDHKKGSDFSIKTNTEFSRKVDDLVKSISDMKKYLVDNQKDYINIYSPLLSLASMMTDRERDEIDIDVENFIKICNDVIKVLRIEANRKNNSQICQHQSLVIDLVEKYLKMVCDIHSQQKAIRIKRAVEKQRLLRLGNIIVNKNTSSHSKNSKINLNSDTYENRTTVSQTFPENNKENDKHYDKVNRTKAIEDLNNETYQQLELSKDELQMFEEENKHLYKEMNSLSDEVKDIEIKVIEIAKLQEMFTDNVLKQEIDLNKLSETTISSTENIRGGNEQLREAMKKNAGFRVWVLFFITTLAFTILFLDWYNN